MLFIPVSLCRFRVIGCLFLPVLLLGKEHLFWESVRALGSKRVRGGRGGGDDGVNALSELSRDGA